MFHTLIAFRRAERREASAKAKSRSTSAEAEVTRAGSKALRVRMLWPLWPGLSSPDPGVMERFVYRFADGGRYMDDLLGGKGAGLAEMTRMGLPVPPGFTITTEACRAFLATGAE